MKSLTELWKVVAEDFSAACDTPIARDLVTVLERVKEEGDSFLTITLPNFCADFERSLDRGRVGSDLFLGFKKRSGLPAFLRGFLIQIFDEDTLELRADASINSIRAVRQLTLIFKKIERECSPERIDAAYAGYRQCEEDLKKVEETYELLPVADARRISSILFGSVFNELTAMINTFALSPVHGPGSTADSVIGNQKFIQTSWPERLEEYFPYGEYVLPHWKYFSEYEPEFTSPEAETPVKVITVPKTLKSPRIIAMEPVAMQYMQQALMDGLVRGIERSPLARHFTHFTNQSLNQEAARGGSIHGSTATLDLSEASDRVLNRFVIDLLAPWPDLVGAVQACRSTRAVLPDSDPVVLRKFASMGSALTFPIEAIVFTTLLFLGIEAHTGKRFTEPRHFDAYRGRVHVYGDDMIVPVGSVHDVIGSLEAFGLKVNRTKSFWNGSFRESCGGDFYSGESVKPIRLKKDLPVTRRDVEQIVSLNAFMNLAFERGMMRTGDSARRALENALGEALKKVPEGSQAIGIQSPPYLCTVESLDPMLQRPVLRAPVVSHQDRKVGVDDVWALRKVFTADWSDPIFRRHLEHSGRPVTSRIRSRWVPIR